MALLMDCKPPVTPPIWKGNQHEVVLAGSIITPVTPPIWKGNQHRIEMLTLTIAL